jgi:hypothetical protein
VNGQVSGSERAGVIEGEASTTELNGSLVLTYGWVIHQECYGMYQVAMVGHSLGGAAGTLVTFQLEDGITSIRYITYGWEWVGVSRVEAAWAYAEYKAAGARHHRGIAGQHLHAMINGDWPSTLFQRASVQWNQRASVYSTSQLGIIKLP